MPITMMWAADLIGAKYHDYATCAEVQAASQCAAARQFGFDHVSVISPFKIILKSLADLPANTLGFASSVPGRAMNASKQMLGASARATRRQIRAAPRRSAEFARAFYARANAPFESALRWQRGGLNE